MFNALEDYVRDYLIQRMKEEQPAHLMYYQDIVNYLIDPWIASKPWWWLINLYHNYEHDFIEVAEANDLPMNRDLRDLAIEVLKVQAWDLLSACSSLSDAFKIYIEIHQDKPHFFNDVVAKDVLHDLIWEV